MDDVEAIRDQIAGVVVVAPLSQSSGTAVRNAANWSTTVNGTTSDYFTAQQWARPRAARSPPPRSRPARPSA